MAALSKVMRDIDLHKLQDLNDIILDFKEGLHHTPDTLDELKVRSTASPPVAARWMLTSASSCLRGSSMS